MMNEYQYFEQFVGDATGIIDWDAELTDEDCRIIYELHIKQVHEEWEAIAARTDLTDEQRHQLGLEIFKDYMVTDEQVSKKIQEYERQFGMSSDEFLKLWKEGRAPDTKETNLWSMLLDDLT